MRENENILRCFTIELSPYSDTSDYNLEQMISAVFYNSSILENFEKILVP